MIQNLHLRGLCKSRCQVKLKSANLLAVLCVQICWNGAITLVKMEKQVRMKLNLHKGHCATYKGVFVVMF